jgi:two-component system, NtrC family, response regulator PilR
MSKAQVLIVDDETDILELLQITLSRMDIGCRAAMDIAAAKRLLASDPFDLCLTDMFLPDGTGIDLVAYIADKCPELPVAVITAHGNMETAVTAMKAGAFDFVAKPVDLAMLRRLVESALRLSGRKGPTNRDPEPGSHGGLLGDSPQMQELRRLIAKLARNQAPVLITGESGTGKELAARLIHSLGPRAEGSFVPVNCGAIPRELVESELFGHKKGSFTGAVSDKQGLFHAAEGGTLFLDEVADLPLDMQVKLLRAIQEKSIRPIGAHQEIPVDVRIISASHLDLDLQVQKQAFRQDLFYRINVIELRMPPLRERPEDIPVLSDLILARIAHQSGVSKPALTPAATTRLRGYGFPGNVRELENILERATALDEDGRIDADGLHLPQAELASARQTTAAPPYGKPLEAYLGEVERQAIVEALEATRWNRTAAAKKLGMTLRSLRYRLSKLGIE